MQKYIKRMPNILTNDNDCGDSSDNNSSDSDLLTNTLTPPMTKCPPGPRETKEKTPPHGLFAPRTSKKIYFCGRCSGVRSRAPKEDMYGPYWVAAIVCVCI